MFLLNLVNYVATNYGLFLYCINVVYKVDFWAASYMIKP